MTNTALVVGASGIVGSNLARRLRARGWQVLGLARRPPADIEGVRAIAADLQDRASLRTALAGLRPTHVFLATWQRQLTEKENVRVNAAMVRNVLQQLSGARSVSHVALVTGLKHYLGRSSPTAKASCPRRHSARSSLGSISRISTTRRRTNCSPRPRATALAGAFTARTRLSATRSEMP
jgi:nucleoside-diphosphate-sugar epimerase